VTQVSLFVRWINQIKEKCTSEWLTDAQQEVYRKVLGLWKHERYMCVYGATGCGKSFIARLLHKENGFYYTNDLKEVPTGTPKVVLDGVEYNRLMLMERTKLGINTLLILCRKRPRDVMPSMELVLTERDVRQFIHRLRENNIITEFRASIEGQLDLNRILCEEAMKRGEEYVSSQSGSDT